MIARIATFPTLPPDVSAEVHRNVLDRFMPALRAQDGFVAGYWLADAAGTWISFTVWESEASGSARWRARQCHSPTARSRPDQDPVPGHRADFSGRGVCLRVEPGPSRAHETPLNTPASDGNFSVAIGMPSGVPLAAIAIICLALNESGLLSSFAR